MSRWIKQYPMITVCCSKGRTSVTVEPIQGRRKVCINIETPNGAHMTFNRVADAKNVLPLFVCLPAHVKLHVDTGQKLVETHLYARTDGQLKRAFVACAGLAQSAQILCESNAMTLRNGAH